MYMNIQLVISCLILFSSCWSYTYAFDQGDRTIHGPRNSCMTVKCSAGYHCEVVQIYCIRAPCLPIAQCVPDKEPPTSGCATVRCAAGTHCEEVQVQCIQAPCNPIAECVPDATEPITSPCAAMLCGPGTQCIVKNVQCFRAPCPAIASCEPI